jgi:hypothetical protein
VEIALPWTALGELARRASPPTDGDQWRVNFSRVEWPLDMTSGAYRAVSGARENNWVWSPQHVIDMHRPESWGYVQFSTRQPGTVTFVQDATLPARRWLHSVYYAQREYRRANGRWASTLEELRVAAPADVALASAALATTDSQFEASVDLRRPGGIERWHIRQDSLIWNDAGP